MANIYGVLDIGKKALFANQTAINVSGNNIANINTPGYSRQAAVFRPTNPVTYGTVLGTGVEVTQVKQAQNKFLTEQLVEKYENMGKYTSLSMGLHEVEAIIDDQSGQGLNTALSNFFSSWQTLSQNPQGISERTELASCSDNLAAVFTRTNTDLTNMQDSLDTEIGTIVTEINGLADDIAAVNAEVKAQEIDGETTANDMRDKRTALLNELAEYIDINFFETTGGEITVLVAGGKPLIEGSSTSDLVTEANSVTGFLDIKFEDDSGNTATITDDIASGKLAGIIQLRDTTIHGYLGDLDKLALTLIDQINTQHALGDDLDGTDGGAFFDAVAPTVADGSSNTGAGTISLDSTPYSDTSVVTRDSYRLTITADNTYSVTNLNTGSVLSTGNTFTPGTEFTVPDTGINVTITGAEAVGDTFDISPPKAAANIAFSSTISADVRKIAAALDGEAAGSNTNALAIADLDSSQVLSSSSATFASYYSSFIGGVGSDTRSADANLEQQETLSTHLENLRESAVGVSMDEELTNLMQYQTAFQAAARLISVVEDMLTTLANL